MENRKLFQIIFSDIETNILNLEETLLTLR